MTADESRIALLLGQDKVLRLRVDSALALIYVYRNPLRHTGDVFEYYLDNVIDKHKSVEIIKTFQQLINRMRCHAALEYWIECEDCP